MTRRRRRGLAASALFVLAVALAASCGSGSVETTSPVLVAGEEAPCPAGRDTCSTREAATALCCPPDEQCCEAAVFGYADGDLCRPRGEACPSACPGGERTCEHGALCLLDPGPGTYGCVDACAQGAACAPSLCCPIGAGCVSEACPLPDLTIDADALADRVLLDSKAFDADACEIFEGCVGAPGDRTLLRFDLVTPNVGDGDLVLGRPQGNPLFEFSDCHGHHHFTSYASYRLLDGAGAVVATGHKQAFCLEDVAPPEGPPSVAKYDCDFQGIQRGWADVYNRSLPCQWVDITGVPPGDYVLEVGINLERVLAESRYDNNLVQVPVTIGESTCAAGCRPLDDVCCTQGDPCGWAEDGSCDCTDAFEWDFADCQTCYSPDPLCDVRNSCTHGCTPPDATCCVPGDPCGLAKNLRCNCGGEQDWDGSDCAACVTDDPDCPPHSSCPLGCTGLDLQEPCCLGDDACGWADNHRCDCGGAPWDAADCANCMSADPECF